MFIMRTKQTILVALFLGLWPFLGWAAQPDATNPDAIAVRIIPNPAHYTVARWYETQGFKGSPQAMTVDGYDAIRDGRTVYVSAVNLDTAAHQAYSNIYLLSYNQNSDRDTEDIFGKILSHWKFNNNLSTTAGSCTISTTNCQTGKDCAGAGLSCQNNRCGLVAPDTCLTDADCPDTFFCDNEKSKVIRDLKRSERVSQIEDGLDKYKNSNGHYPALSAGTYIPGASLSVWSSWKNMLTDLDLSQNLVDPINTLGPCYEGGFDPQTCWNEKARVFYLNSTAANLSLPIGSRALAYFAKDNNLQYGICAMFESHYQIAGSTVVKCSTNRAPVLQDAVLTGKSGENFSGWLRASDADGDDLAWTLQPTYVTCLSACNDPAHLRFGDNTFRCQQLCQQANVWLGSLSLQATGDTYGKILISSQPAFPGTYNVAVGIDDGQGGKASKLYSLDVKNDPALLTADDFAYTLGAAPLDYNMYAEKKGQIIGATVACGPDLKFTSGALADHVVLTPLSDDTSRIKLSGTLSELTGATVFNCRLAVTDYYGGITSQDFKLTVTVRPIYIDNQCPSAARWKGSYNCQLTAKYSDDNTIVGSGVTFSYLGLPDNLSGSDAGVVSGTPTVLDSPLITIRAKNNFGGRAETSFNLKINTWCGDSVLQAPNDEGRGGPLNDGNEACDGSQGLASSYSDSSAQKQYGCAPDCKPAGGYCGDGVCGPSDKEYYGVCPADCPYCGDGKLQADKETCDDGASNGQYSHCNAACTGLGEHCGDGIIQPSHETCDGDIACDAYHHTTDQYFGTAKCASDCQAYDLSGCVRKCDPADACCNPDRTLKKATDQPTGLTCGKCDGVSSTPVFQTASEDIFNQCSVGSLGSANDCLTGTCNGGSFACGLQPITSNPGGACRKCLGTSPNSVPQGSSEDLFNQCTKAAAGSADDCLSGDCNGSGACGVLSANSNPGGLCRKCGGASANSAFESSSEDLFAQCAKTPAGSPNDCLSGKCNGGGACSFMAANSNPGGTCRKCSGVTADSIFQSTAEDLFNQCVVGWTSCDNACAKRGSTGNCGGTGACDTNGNAANVAVGNICSSGNEIAGACNSVYACTNQYNTNGAYNNGQYGFYTQGICNGLGVCNRSAASVDPNSNPEACACKSGGSHNYWALGGEVNPAGCCGASAGQARAASTFSASITTVNDNTVACCSSATDCVRNNICYPSGTNNIDVDGNNENDYCAAGTWQDCNTDSECPLNSYCNAGSCDALASPTITAHNVACGSGDNCSGKARIAFSWNPVPGAQTYLLYIYNGNNYEAISLGNSTSWDSDTANIYPTSAEINSWNGGDQIFRTGGDGGDLPEDPNYLYFKSGGSYATKHFYYWLHLAAGRTSGHNSGAPWSGATWLGGEDTPECSCYPNGNLCSTAYNNYSNQRFCTSKLCILGKVDNKDYCCDSACTGACSRCDLPGKLGTCSDDSSLCASGGFCQNGTCKQCNPADPCCNSDGTFKSSGAVCRASSGACDPTETCSGASGLCPADSKLSSGTVCRAAVGGCDKAETCDGTSNACPTDSKLAAGTTCRAAAGVCDKAETCDGTSNYCPTDDKLVGNVCRVAADVCDKADTCDGYLNDCPPDAKQPNTTVCRPATDVCDAMETCDGYNNPCPSDGYLDSSNTCGPLVITGSAGACTATNNIQHCSGSDPDCTGSLSYVGLNYGYYGKVFDGASSWVDPTASIRCGQVPATCANSTTAKFTVQGCDGVGNCNFTGSATYTQACTGATPYCQSFGCVQCDWTKPCCAANGSFKTAGTICRAAAGVCDKAETCDGNSQTCPANAYQPSSYFCGTAPITSNISIGTCNVANADVYCTGTSNSCSGTKISNGSYSYAPANGYTWNGYNWNTMAASPDYRRCGQLSTGPGTCSGNQPMHYVLGCDTGNNCNQNNLIAAPAAACTRPLTACLGGNCVQCDPSDPCCNPDGTFKGLASDPLCGDGIIQNDATRKELCDGTANCNAYYHTTQFSDAGAPKCVLDPAFCMGIFYQTTTFTTACTDRPCFIKVNDSRTSCVGQADSFDAAQPSHWEEGKIVVVGSQPACYVAHCNVFANANKCRWGDGTWNGYCYFRTDLNTGCTDN
jgi:hypothetical protein